MKANRRAVLTHQDDETAVTAILGAILITVLLVGVLVTIRLQFVPVWEENSEAAHMLQVENEMSILRAQMDRQAGNTSAANVANQITLGQSRVSLFSQHALPPALGFRPTPAKSLTLGADNITLFFANGTLVATPDNEWKSINATTFVDDVVKALALRLRMPDPSTLAQGGSDPDEWVLIEVTQAGGSYGGEFRVDLDSAPSQYVLKHTTKNADGAVVTQISTSYHQQTKLEPYYYVNALEDNFVFDQVLAAADAPFALTLRNSGGFAGASYSIVFFEGDGSGNQVLVGEGGISFKNFLRPFSSGTLTYSANNNYFVAQDLVIEHGALILDQGNGAVFKVKPGFTVTQVGQTTGVSLTLPSMTGSERLLSGDLVTIVNTQRGLGQSFIGVTDAFNITVQTDYPAVWAGFFRDAMTDQELEEGSHFEIDQGTTSVTLAVTGMSNVSDIRDISLNVVQANIILRLEA